MTAAERLYQLIQTFPESQINEVLNFAEFLHQKQLSPVKLSLPALSPDLGASPNGLNQFQIIIIIMMIYKQNIPTISPKNNSLKPALAEK